MGRPEGERPIPILLRVLALAAAALVLLPQGGSALASPTVRLTIRHVISHCHVWVLKGRERGAASRITVTAGTRLDIRADCPMDFDFVQTRGPRLALGKARTYAGTTRAIVFRKPGVYRLRLTNVQTPEARGLETLGEPNVLLLTVAVK